LVTDCVDILSEALALEFEINSPDEHLDQLSWQT